MASTNQRTLYAISQDLRDLYDRLEELGGDVTAPEIEQEIDAWFDRLGQERDQKLDNYAALITELEARAEARKAEGKRLYDRARRDTDQADYLKHRLVHFFQQHGLKTIETPRYRLTVRRSGGKAPIVLKTAPEDLPEAFQRWKVSADLEAIREALERGEALDVAELGERGYYVRIS